MDSYIKVGIVYLMKSTIDAIWSVGYNEGNITDVGFEYIEGEEWSDHWNKGKTVSLEDGTKALKEYVNNELDWKELQPTLTEIEAKIIDIDKGVWKLWGEGIIGLHLGVKTVEYV